MALCCRCWPWCNYTSCFSQAKVLSVNPRCSSQRTILCTTHALRVIVARNASSWATRAAAADRSSGLTSRPSS
jgi:hypothetical protein